MKNGKSIVELATEIQRQQATKKDFVADTRAIEMVPIAEDGQSADLEPQQTDVALAWPSNGDGRVVMPVTDIAHGQIGDRFSIPRKFYQRLQADHPDLLAHNVTALMQREPQKRMLRTLDNRVRAFLSDRYRPLDNAELFEAIFPALRELGVRVVSSEVTDRRMYIKFLAMDCHVDAPDLMPPNRRDPHGDLMTPDSIMPRGEFAGLPLSSIVAGGVISNSEVGLGTLRVEQLRFFVRCLNGWIDATVVKQTHVGRSTGFQGIDASEFYRDETRLLDDAALFSKVRDTLASMFRREALNDWVAMARTSKERKIEDPTIVPQVVEVVGNRLSLNEGHRRGVLASLIEDGDLSAWGVSNAITAVSQKVEDYDMATDLESEGNKVLQLRERDWHSILAEAKRLAA